MENTIKVKPINTKEIKDAETGTGLMLTNAENSLIKTQRDYEVGATLLKEVKATAKDLDIKRRTITKPLDEAKKAVMDLFRKPLDMLTRAESLIKKRMVVYTTEQERIRKEREDKLRRQAEAEERRKKKALEDRAKKAEEAGNTEKAAELREKAEEIKVDAPVLAPTVETPKGISYKDRWYAVVVDKTKLPIEYLMPDMLMLNRFAVATKGKIPVSGVEFKSEKIVAGRI